MRLPLIAALCTGIALATVAVRPAPAADAPAVGPDIVRLKNGGILRGTISELVPGDYVVIVGPNGTKKFPMSEVSYAGKADREGTAPGEPAKIADESGKPSPEITIHAEKAHLRLTSTPAGYTFHKQTGSGMAAAGGVVAVGVNYTEVCSAPCEATIAAGSHTLALSKPGGMPVPAMPVTVPAGDSQIVATYTDNSKTRFTGLIIAVVGLAGGLTLVAVESDTTWGLWGGLGLTVGGTLVGTFMMYTPDETKFQVTPVGGSAYNRRNAGQAMARIPGLSFRGSF